MASELYLDGPTSCNIVDVTASVETGINVTIVHEKKNGSDYKTITFIAFVLVFHD